MKIPGFNAEASVYRTRHHYCSSRWISGSDPFAYPALLTEGSDTPGMEGCVSTCEQKCVKNAGCDALSTAKKIKCKAHCNTKCEQWCTQQAIGKPTPPPETSDFFDDLWGVVGGIFVAVALQVALITSGGGRDDCTKRGGHWVSNPDGGSDCRF